MVTIVILSNSFLNYLILVSKTCEIWQEMRMSSVNYEKYLKRISVTQEGSINKEVKTYIGLYIYIHRYTSIYVYHVLTQYIQNAWKKSCIDTIATVNITFPVGLYEIYCLLTDILCLYIETITGIFISLCLHL